MRAILKKKVFETASEVWAFVDHEFYQGVVNMVDEVYEKKYHHDEGAWTAIMNGKGAHLVEELIPDKEVE